jgi:YfiR/HmsC-like
MISRASFHRLVIRAAVAGILTLPVRAQSVPEYDVKAALLLNFARFIEWPDGAFAGPRSPIEICVFEPNPFGDSLNRVLQAETVGSRPLVSRAVRAASESASCHLLFVPAGAESRAAPLVTHAGPHTVTVGESRAFEARGGAVSFTVEDGRVRFNVNLRPVEERGVRISARMLHLAGRVDRATPPK